MRRLPGIVLTILCLAGTSPAFAQLCIGSGPIDRSTPAHGGFGIAVAEGSVGFAGGVVAGVDAAFANLSIGRTMYTDGDFSTFNIAVGAGAQAKIAADGKTMICPTVQFAHQSASNVDFGADLSANQIAFGLSIGVVVAETPSMKLVPTIGFGVVRNSVEVGIFDDSATSGVVNFGVGIVGQAATVTPMLSVGFNGNDVAPAFVLTFAFHFTRR